MAELLLHWTINGAEHDARITDEAPATIGREATCDVRIESPSVSRQHAQVRRGGEGFVLRDLTDGRNPIYVNRMQLTRETLLNKDDELMLANVSLVVTDVRGIARVGGPTLTLHWTIDGHLNTATVRGGDPATIGREESATVFIDHPAVSRENARIREEGGRFAVTDLRPDRNPVLLNGKPLVGERFLNPGDRLIFGHGVVEVQVTHPVRPGARMVQCYNCGRIVEQTLVCPYCGYNLDMAVTVLPSR